MKSLFAVLSLATFVFVGCSGPQKSAETTETVATEAVDSVAMELDKAKAEIDQSVEELDKAVNDLN